MSKALKTKDDFIKTLEEFDISKCEDPYQYMENLISALPDSYAKGYLKRCFDGEETDDYQYLKERLIEFADYKSVWMSS